MSSDLEAGAPADVPAPPVLVRATPSSELVSAWTLVLEALSIPHQIVRRDPWFELWVNGADQPRAEAALAAYDRDRREEANAVMPAVPDQGRSAAGIGFVIAIAAFYWVTGARDGGDPGHWFARGAAIAEKIVSGELWRAVTALTLHADPSHVAGNAVAALIFVSALGRWVGGGVALLLTLLGGIAGNLTVAFLYRGGHNSIGASTATFAALGILGGLQVVRWLRGRTFPGSRRRALSVIAACLGVFAMLGVGERVDVLAHLFGLAAGLVIGAATGYFARPPLPRWLDLACGVLTVAVIAGAWVLAFR